MSGIRDTLRAHLKQAMLDRDKPAVEGIRIALAKIENAEAQPLDGPQAAAAAAGGGDVPRRLVTDDEARALVQAEAGELEASAAEYRTVGQPDAAATLDAQAAALRHVLAR